MKSAGTGLLVIQMSRALDSLRGKDASPRLGKTPK